MMGLSVSTSRYAPSPPSLVPSDTDWVRLAVVNSRNLSDRLTYASTCGTVSLWRSSARTGPANATHANSANTIRQEVSLPFTRAQNVGTLIAYPYRNVLIERLRVLPAGFASPVESIAAAEN